VTPHLYSLLRDLSAKANMSQSAIIKHCLATELPKLKKKYQ
tara:strand:+ start:331 stop:453 length:123 start_codon:yes stop_codon:yes gene_type:complete